MDRFAAMQLFVRIAELGSFAAAAQQLDLDRSMVTRQINALEAHLGCKLMVRSTRRLTLTSAGLAYLEQCKVILGLVDAAESELAVQQQIPRGHIRISLPLSFGLKRLTPLLLEFAHHHPEVSLDLDYSDRRQNLIEEGIDLSIRITNQLADNDVVRKLGVCRMKLVAAQRYLQQHGTPQQPADLAHHIFLGYSNSHSRSLPFMVDEQIQNIPLKSRIHANNGDFLVQAAIQGLGIACQPDFIVDEFIKTGQVEELLSNYAIPELGIYAVYASNRHIPHRVRVLVDFLAQGLTTDHSDFSSTATPENLHNQ